MSFSDLSNICDSFQTASGTSRINESNPANKRPAPLSVRVSDRERKALLRAASGKPLNRFVRERLFDAKGKVRESKQPDVADIARMLRALGETDVFRNLDKLMQCIDDGTVILSDEQQQDIGAACAAVLLMRRDLMTALGLREE